MGAICCLVKAGLPLHHGSSQNDDRKGQTFFRGGEERRELDKSRLNKCKKGVFTGGSSSVLWNKINASIKRRNQRGAPQRSVLSQIEESGLLSQKPDSFLKRGVSFLKKWACSETTSRTPDFKRSICPDVSSLVTCNWQLCENLGQFVEAPIQKSKREIQQSKTR